MQAVFDREAWLEAIDEDRREATDYYVNQFDWRGAPIPDDYTGPRYFPPDEQWRIPAKLDRDAPGTGTHVQLLTSIGAVRDMNVCGTFVFTVDGQEQRLTAYQMASAPAGYDQLFVPFLDATSGKETYGAGRYLDVTLQEGNDDYILDFNRAYNPSCAYSPRWNCPYPPSQNRLSVAVEAGEKVPFEHRH